MVQFKDMNYCQQYRHHLNDWFHISWW